MDVGKEDGEGVSDEQFEQKDVDRCESGEWSRQLHRGFIWGIIK